MKRERLQLALERLAGSDWERFEQLASQFLASEFRNLRTVASKSGDRGRDALLYCDNSDATVLLQYSVRGDWDRKIKETAEQINKEFPRCRILIYVTNQLIGAKADQLSLEIKGLYKIFLDIRDQNYFLERYLSNPQCESAAESLASVIVDPYLASREVIESKAQALTSLEARAALVYLNLQWEDDSREKGLTKLSFDALVRAALRNTDSEHRITRTEVHSRVRSFVPSHQDEQVNLYTDRALKRLEKRFIRHWHENDEFCLAHEEILQGRDRLALLEQKDAILRSEIIERSRLVLFPDDVTKNKDKFEADVPNRIRRVLERFLLSRGESFANAVVTGHYQNIGFDELKNIVITDTSQNPPQFSEPIIDQIMSITKEIITNPGEATQAYLRGLADSYTLLAFLRETPDVQSSIVKMFAHGEIWLDTSIVLPLFSEDLLDPERRQFTHMINAAKEAGLTLLITRGVLEEIERHMNLCETCLRTTEKWEGHLPFLYSAFVLSGRSLSEFGAWLDRFRGRARPEDDIAEYLGYEFGIHIGSLTGDANQASDDLRVAVQEAWHTFHERRRVQGHRVMDLMVQHRLVEHDVENYLGVICRRRNEPETSLFGYKYWWLTLDRTAWEIEAAVKDRLIGKPPASPVLSADFLSNYLSFGPVRNRVSKNTESALPIALASEIMEFATPELSSLAQKVRNDSKDLPERLIRRRVRDSLDSAKSRIGPIARGGLEAVLKSPPAPHE